MIGQNEAFRHLFEGNAFDGVFVMVGDAPKDFDPESQDFALPMIYTEQTQPNKLHLAFLKGQLVHLIHSKNASDEFFYSWYTHLSSIGIKTLVALDSENELYVQ
jgi:hypothetical protein